FAPPPMLKPDDFKSSDLFLLKDGDLDVFHMEQWCLQGASELLELRGLKLDETCSRLLAKCMGRVVQRASLQLKRLADGEPAETVMPFTLPNKPSASSRQGPVSFSKL